MRLNDLNEELLCVFNQKRVFVGKLEDKETKIELWELEK